MGDRPSQTPTGKFPSIKVPPAARLPTFRTEDGAPEPEREATGSATGNPRRRFNSQSVTLPSPYVVPKLLMAYDQVPWFNFDERTQSLVALIDGVRTIAELSERAVMSAGELQLRIADLRDRGVVGLD